MTPPQQHSSQFRIAVNGTPLPDAVAQCLVSAFVDDSLTLPDMFALAFRDTERSVIANGRFQIGGKVSVKVFSDDHPGGKQLFSGEITSLEATYDVDGTMTTVRGFDDSHRLLRGRVTAAYKNMSYSDVARKVASRAGLPIGTVDSSSPVHDHVTQANVSDWQFLRGLAAEIGYEMGCVDAKFVFRRPPQAASGPPAGNLRSSDPLQLILGKNLLRFRSVVSAAEQVATVKARGWDMLRKQAVVGEAPARTQSATVGVTPAALGQTFKAPDYVSTHVPFGSAAEVTSAAASLADQIAGSLTEVEGVARGNPKLRAGTVVSLGLVNPPFDGKLLVSSTRHVYDPVDGYTVWFTVSGRQERSMYGLAGANGTNGTGPNHPVHGVVMAIVTNNDDPEKLARVKVKFPWLADDYESPWARLVAPGAGPGRGTVILPEVNDEVLVAFEHGDMRRPYVIGGVYNGKDKPELGTGLVKGGKVERRGFISKKGHKIVFLDGDAKSGVMLATVGNGFRIALNDKPGMTIRIVSKGKVEIQAQQDVKIDAKANVSITAAAKMDLKATAGLTIDGGPQVVIKGAVIKLN